MVPLEVLIDSGLAHCDVRVYGILASSRRGPYVSLGNRRLAEMAGIHRRAARRSLAALVARKHVEVEAAVKGRRAKYKLVSAVFVGRKREVTAAEPVVAGKPAPELIRCPKCGKNARGLLRVGWCRSCNWELKVARIADGRIAVFQVDRKTA